jgi:predicted TIM-barrel fold metal-dependent hydrolase
LIPANATDCHAHVMQRGRALAANRHSEPARDVTVHEYLGVLDAAGLARGVLTAPSFYGTDNSLLLEALHAAHGRLRGTVILDPEAEPLLDGLDRAGVAGVRLNWIRRTDLPDAGSPGYQRLFAAVRERSWHIELYLEGSKIPQVLPHLLRSRARITLDHFGGADAPGGIASPGFGATLDAVRDGNTWVKLSAPYRLGGADPRPFVDALLDAAGPHRLVWASDWPWVGHEGRFTYANCLAWLSDWVPDAASRQVILTETPADLFRF